jgi:hypothetical protein
MSGKDLRSALPEIEQACTLSMKFLTSYATVRQGRDQGLSTFVRDQRNDQQSAKSKCVVFSQFVGVLDVAAEG